MMNAFLMYGYFHDPYHICFYLLGGFVQTSDPNHVPVQEIRTMSLELVLDVCLTLNIIVTALTSYQKDAADYENEIVKIVLNYARGAMIFDIASSVPALFLD